MSRLFLSVGAVSAAFSIALGAYAAHADLGSELRTAWLEKAARYQMYHALALMVTALLCSRLRPSRRLNLIFIAGWCFIGGTTLFSGSLVVMALSSLDAGLITPLGGLLLIAGWLLLAGTSLGDQRT